MKLIFSRLKLTDFKGINEFEITFDEKLTKIIGENGTGKTTIPDAISWVFFGEDSLGRSKFDIFPLDENNQIIPKKKPTVELEFFIDGEQTTIQKIQGKSCEYYYDGHQVKANEYAERINEIITKKLFSALINPVFFGDNYTWQEQKSIILDNMNVKNDTIEIPKYKNIKKDIVTYGYESTFAKYDKKIKDADKSLIGLSSTKDYIHKNLEGKQTDLSKEDLAKRLTVLKEKIKEMDESRTILLSYEKELNTVENEITIDKNKFNNDVMVEKSNIDRVIKDKTSEKTALLNEYKKLASSLKTISDTCTYCGSKIDEKEVKKQKKTLKDEIDKIITKGNLLADEIETQKTKLNNVNEEYRAKENLVNKKDKLNKQIENIKSSFDEELYNETKTEIGELETQISGFEKIISFQNDLKETQETINKTTIEKEEAEIMVELIKEYNREYSQLVADQLNAQLKDVKIKTFNLQKNGDTKETFEITRFGVPYKSLNSAGKIIAGVELIQLINNSLNIDLPIIIDNKESITKNFDVKNQVITLEVVGGVPLSV